MIMSRITNMILTTTSMVVMDIFIAIVIDFILI